MIEEKAWQLWKQWRQGEQEAGGEAGAGAAKRVPEREMTLTLWHVRYDTVTCEKSLNTVSAEADFFLQGEYYWPCWEMNLQSSENL